MKKYILMVLIFSVAFCFLCLSHLHAQSTEKQPLKRKHLTIKYGPHGRPYVNGVVRKFKTPDPSSLSRLANSNESNFDVETEKFNKEEYEADPQQLDAAMQRVDDNGYPIMENAYHRMAEEQAAAQQTTNSITNRPEGVK